MANVQVIEDYIKQLRRHTKGRRAVIVKLSSLEKQFHESMYRQKLAASLMPVAKNYSGEFFPLPNKDGLIIVKDASIDVIDIAIDAVRTAVSDSSVIKNLDPVQGVSDDFCQWYSLEDQYDRLVEDFQAILDAPEPQDLPEQNQHSEINGTQNTSDTERYNSKVSMPNGQKLVEVVPPKARRQEKQLNPESLLQLSNAIKSTDLEGMINSQWVKAVVPGQEPVNIMLHKFIPFDKVVHTLIPTLEVEPDIYLAVYLSGLIDAQLIKSKPDMRTKDALMTNIRLSFSTVLSDSFQNFDRMVAAGNQKNIVIELDFTEYICKPDQINAVTGLVKEKGYKLCLSGLDPRSFNMLDLSLVSIDFIKLQWKGEAPEDLDDLALVQSLKASIKNIGAARIILAGCDSDAMLAFGQAIGIVLFQGNVISPIE